MANDAKAHQRPLMPVLRYRDCNAAVDFLTDDLRLHRGQRVPRRQGNVQHAELCIRQRRHHDRPGRRYPVRQGDAPAERGRRRDGELFAVVNDPDAHHARVEGAGFEIVLPLRDESYGSREYSVRDPEGHIWTFGTYDPSRRRRRPPCSRPRAAKCRG